MIDTTQRSHQYDRLDFARLLRRGATEHLHIHPIQGRSTRYVFNPTDAKPDCGAALPQITVYNREGSPARVLSQVSVPKLLYGTNAREVTDSDLTRAYKLESEFVSDFIGRCYDARDALLSRLDLCRNFQTDDEGQVRAYIGAVATGRLPHRVRVLYGETAAYFKAESCVTLLYGKYDETRLRQRRHQASETDVRAARGVLRLEDRYKGRALTAMLDRYQLPHDKRATSLLSSAIADRVITDRLTALGLHRQVVTTDARVRALIACFGARAVELYGALELRRDLGESFWAEVGWSRSKFYRVRKELMDAGLWLAAPTAQPLPALTDVPRARPELRLVKAA